MTNNLVGNEVSPAFTFQSWREGFLRLILRGAVIVGFIALIPAIINNIGSPVLYIFPVVYAILLVITFAPIPYGVRAWVFIALFFLLGINDLLDTGIWGDSRIFFLAMVMVTAMLVSPRASIWMAVLSLVTTALVGGLVLTSTLELRVSLAASQQVTPWLSAIAVLLMLDAIMITGLNLLQNGFVQAQERSTQALADLRAERSLLEQRVEIRTQESIHKTTQLEAASRVARNITEIRDLQALLDSIVLTIAEQFKLYHVGIFLLDEESVYAVLQAASSEGGKAMLAAGHRLKVGAQGIVGFVTEQSRPRIATDVDSDAVFRQNPYLPATHSEMALPLIARDRVIGALDIQSESAQAFDEADLEIMQTLADQVATAIENARLFSESQAIIGQFETLRAIQTPEAWSTFLKGRKTGYQYTQTGIRPLTASSLDDNAKTLRIPLAVRGQEIGVINIRRKIGGPDWTPREQELAREIAAQIALALENARLFEETARRAEIERLTSDISTRISASSLYDSIIKTAAEELSRALGGSDVIVQIQPSEPHNGSSPARSSQRVIE